MAPDDYEPVALEPPVPVAPALALLDTVPPEEEAAAFELIAGVVDLRWMTVTPLKRAAPSTELATNCVGV